MVGELVQRGTHWIWKTIVLKSIGL